MAIHKHKPIPQLSQSDIDRFWGFVDRSQLGPGGCWEWNAATNPLGYGLVWIKSNGDYVQRRAPRVAFRIGSGSDPGDLFVCHKCDNPMCVRPDHLFLGDDQANVDDMIRKGRRNGRKFLDGEGHELSKLKNEDVMRIRELSRNGMGSAAISRRFCVNPQTISKIVHRHLWKHLP